VASSKIRISGFLRNNLAIESLCFSQPLNFNHLSQITESSHFSSFNTKSASAFLSAISKSVLVAFLFANKRFSLIVRLNKLLSCDTIHICFLNDFKFKSFILILSSNIFHESTHQNLKNKLIIVDFPAHVFHTNATLSHGFTLNDIFFITSVFVYEKDTFLNSISHFISLVFIQLSLSYSDSKLSNSL
jgi:hypothetical protein